MRREKPSCWWISRQDEWCEQKTCQSRLSSGPRRITEEDQVKEKAAEVNKNANPNIFYVLAYNKTERKQWLVGMVLEMNSLEALETWVFFEGPRIRKIIPRRWILAAERNAMSQKEWFKTRPVRKWFMQIDVIYIYEVFPLNYRPKRRRYP